MHPERIAELLTDAEASSGVSLSAYGYVMWTLEHCGLSEIPRGALARPSSVHGYMEDAKSFRDDMPKMLLNASRYSDKVFNTLEDLDSCMYRLEGMSYPYVLYILFAAAGKGRLVAKYRTETQEQLRRYPATLDKLPELFREAGKELLEDANTEQG